MTEDDRAVLPGAFLAVADKLQGDEGKQTITLWRRLGQRVFGNGVPDWLVFAIYCWSANDKFSVVHGLKEGVKNCRSSTFETTIDQERGASVSTILQSATVPC